MAGRKRRKRHASSPKIAIASTVGKYHHDCVEGPLPIRLYSDLVLREKALPVQEITVAERKLAADMLATMYASPIGVGLAAPQVGILKRLIVIDLDRDNPEGDPLVLFNPKVQSLEGELVAEEGCLSFPGITADVKRAAKVVVTAQDIDGAPICLEGEDLLARALQHEIDHLDGILFIDHVSGLKRKLLRGKLRKLQRQLQQS
jgi:peptide deformylase